MTCSVQIEFDHGPLGPIPRQAISALAELGLSNVEIARYFGVRCRTVRRLRQRRETWAENAFATPPRD